MNNPAASRLYECFGSGDLEGAVSLLSENVEWILHGPSHVPYFGKYLGHEGFRRFWQSLMEEEEILDFSVREFVTSSDGDRVFVYGNERCKSRATGVSFEATWLQVLSLDRGLIVKFEEYIDSAAVSAAYSGLKETTGGRLPG